MVENTSFQKIIHIVQKTMYSWHIYGHNPKKKTYLYSHPFYSKSTSQPFFNKRHIHSCVHHLWTKISTSVPKSTVICLRCSSTFPQHTHQSSSTSTPVYLSSRHHPLLSRSNYHHHDTDFSQMITIITLTSTKWSPASPWQWLQPGPRCSSPGSLSPFPDPLTGRCSCRVPIHPHISSSHITFIIIFIIIITSPSS